MSTTAGLG